MRVLAVVFGFAVALASCGQRDPLARIRPDLRICFGAEPEQCGSPLQLGAHPAGAPIPLELAVDNVGNGVLGISEASQVDGDTVALGELPPGLAPGARASWELVLTPTLGEGSATIQITSNDADEPRQSYVLLFTGEPCVNGTVRACGSDVGACEPGTSECADELWQPCVGSIDPVDEVCNGADDDCDGEADEQAPCDDGVFCNGAEVCFEGACIIGEVPGCTDPVAHPDLNGPCTVGVCDEASRECVLASASEGALCDDGAFCTTGETCQGGACTGGVAIDCTSLDDACNVGACDEANLRCVQTPKPSCVCDINVDADFDGSDQCEDCDDRNGGVFPGGTERCNGLDDDCDGRIDEDFDGDGDTYSTCAIQPEDRDCDDGRASVHPGAPENCDDGMGGQTGNGLDEDCDGYVDDGCQPCQNTDPDGDGVTECQGDCAPSAANRYPGNPEACDGVDNDCNIFTVDNCEVSDPCNFDGDGDPSDDADVCRDDLLCACLVNRQGVCNGTYRCTSYCNGIVTGELGNLCAADERCNLSLLRSANVHGCERVTEPLGTKHGAEACADSNECRSGNCMRFPFTGSGQKDYCYAPCSSDGYCGASGTVCRLGRSSADLDGQCWPVGRPGLGATPVGSPCTSDFDCDHGLCATEASGQRYCTEGCCQDADCPSGFMCSLNGDQVPTTYIIPHPDGPSCTSNAQCPDGLVCYVTGQTCAYRLTETAPMCLRDGGGQGARRAGAACSSNAECASGFCTVNGTCLETCCSDATCPLGLTCELQNVETRDGQVTAARVCVNLTTEDVIERR